MNLSSLNNPIKHRNSLPNSLLRPLNSLKSLSFILLVALFINSPLNAATDNNTVNETTVSSDIVIGLAGPFSGPNQFFGDQFRLGAFMAFNDINEQGGLLGHKIRVIGGDDQSNPAYAVNVAQQLADKGVKFVVGHFNSGASIPASQIYNKHEMIQISPASTNSHYTTRGMAYMFRVSGRDDYQGNFVGKYLAKKYLKKNVAILHDSTDYGQNIAIQVKKTFNELKGHEVMFEAIIPGRKDYTDVIKKMKSLGVKVIFLGGYHPEAGLIARQVRENKLNAVLIGPDSFATRELSKIAGEAAEGTIFTFEPDYRKYAAAQTLVQRFLEEKIDPQGYVLNTYAAFQIIQQAVQKANSLSTADIIQVIHGGSFDTVMGTLKFDNNGDVIDPKYELYQFNVEGSYSEMSDKQSYLSPR